MHASDACIQRPCMPLDAWPQTANVLVAPNRQSAASPHLQPEVNKRGQRLTDGPPPPAGAGPTAGAQPGARQPCAIGLTDVWQAGGFWIWGTQFLCRILRDDFGGLPYRCMRLNGHNTSLGHNCQIINLGHNNTGPYLSPVERWRNKVSKKFCKKAGVHFENFS